MKIISHRRNTIAQLLQTPSKYGVEVDIRSSGHELCIHHDPFENGENFTSWIDRYEHGTLILNVKEEGLEDRLLAEMARRQIDDFFFLDQSFPFLVKSARNGEHRCAVRVSEFESKETALSLAGQVDWIWVDCFTQLPLTGRDAAALREAGFRLCLVSPELQGRDSPDELQSMRAALSDNHIVIDAVCTKTPHLWE